MSAEFTVSLWLEVPTDRSGISGGLASQFDPATRCGFNLDTVSSAGGYSGPSDELRISFGVDAGSEPRWLDLGRPSPTSNYVSNSLTVFEGRIHAATSDAPEPSDRAHVYRHLGEKEWENLGKVGVEGASGVGPMVVHRGGLYAATWNYDWTRVQDQDLRSCRVYHYESPGRWADCGQPGASKRLFGIASWRGDLFVAGDDRTIHAYRGGQRWEQIAAFDTFAHPLGIHGGDLILGMLQPASVQRFDGRAWRQLGNPLDDPQRCDEVHAIATHRGELVVGTWPLGCVARWDEAGARWTEMGRLGDSTEVMDLTVYNGKLYAGTIPRAELFRYELDGSWTGLRRFYDPAGWQPVPVADVDRTPDGDRRMRDWSRITSLTEHAGLLYASIGSCTSAAIDAPADVRGSVYALGAGIVATTPHSLEPGWHHVAATARSSGVSIHVDGREAATSTGRLPAPVAREAPLRIGSGEAGAYRGRLDGFRLDEIPLDDRQIAALAASRPVDSRT
ncbi:MAG: LamG-like jellyroll fold domain-containing protein [Chloroflexota bacterium]